MTATRSPGGRIARHRLFITLMLAPAALFMLVWILVPTVLSLGLGFTSYFLGGTVQWTGLQNFQRLFADESFWNSLNVTLIYVGEVAVPVVLISVIAGRLISGNTRGNGIVMTALFIPFVFPGVAIAIVFGFLFAPYGLINQLLGTQTPWLTDPRTAMVAVSVVTVWGLLGYFTIVMSAAYRQIPPEILEAAKLDGAGALRTFLHIELPTVRPALIFTTITVIASVLTNFGSAFVMTRGGPSAATTTLPLFVFNQAFRYGDTGYASVAATVLLLLAVIVVVFVVRLLRDARPQRSKA